MRRGLSLPTVLAILCLAAPLRAQEAQVPLDEAGRLMEINRSLAQRLGLLVDDYPDLEVVRLYDLGGGSFILEITRERDGRRLRERVPMTADEVRAFRARVTAAVGAEAPQVVMDQDGRYLLLGTTTFLGLAFYGVAMPEILGIDSGRGTLATYMLTAGASFLVPYLYTRERPVTYGMANAGFWGTTRGLAHGLYLAGLLDSGGSERHYLTLGMLGSVGEGLAGYHWARASDMTAGRAHTVGNYGDFGTAWVGTGLVMLQPDQEQLSFAALLAGAGIGLAYGAARSRALPYTWGDAEIQRLAFFLGAGNGAVAWDWFFNDANTDEVRVLGIALLAGSVGGLLAINRALEDHDFTVGQAVLVDLGTIAGGLLGAGMGVLVSSTDEAGATAVLTLSALGANLGFLATMASLSDDARSRAERAPTGSLELELNPGALLLLRGADRGRPAGHGFQVPLVAFRYRF